MKKKENSQKIKCDVESCKYQDCKSCCCNLEEIEIKNMAGDAQSKDETICASFKIEKNK